MDISAALPVGNLLPAAGATDPNHSTSASPGAGTNFIDLANAALKDVSTAQNNATVAEASYSAGVPGATLGRALVASDQAEVAWNATVAVRDELVSAYQSITNMQF
jgi:flagellar hook-basal body complex protein FliE